MSQTLSQFRQLLVPKNLTTDIVIGGGRKTLRDALYMPALAAMRFNPDLKAKYTQLRETGKPPKVAIVAIMRKLLETANALVKADRLRAPKCACT